MRAQGRLEAAKMSLIGRSSNRIPKVCRQFASIGDRSLGRKISMDILAPITFSAPMASTAMAAVKAESIPPLTPTMALRKPHLAM